MTTEETAKATKESKPESGEVLVYIDYQGNKLHQKPAKSHQGKKEKDDQ